MTADLLLALARVIGADYASGAPPTWQNPAGTCHVFHGTVAWNGAVYNCINFQGTTTLEEWIFADFNPLETPVYISPQIGPVHQASLTNVLSVLPGIQAVIAALGNPPFLLCGHSKGGREAAIASALLKATGTPALATALFECPRPGGEQLAAYLRGEDIVSTRTWNSSGADIVTLMPFGPGWADPCPLLDLRVPDDFGIAEKHRITGVIAGLCALA